jgi:hypothetical protein
VFCPNCGTQNDENNAKCQKCGFSIKGALAPKFKGTMLMMNAPPAVAQRLPSPGGTGPAAMAAKPVPAPAPVPKKPLAKMTMIGVAPPSPGAVAPPAAKPELKMGTMVQSSVPPSKPSGPPGQGAAAAPRPSAPPAARQSGSRPPVNPFGGTMLMGAVDELLAGSQAGSVDANDLGAAIPQPDVIHPAAPATAAVTTQDQAAALSTTTPSVAPPELANPQKLPSEMATVASAVSPPVGPGPAASAVSPVPAPPAAQPEWGKPAVANMADPLAVAGNKQTSSAGSLALAPPQKSPSLFLLLVLGLFTLGVYPLVIWLARKRRSKA